MRFAEKARSLHVQRNSCRFFTKEIIYADENDVDHGQHLFVLDEAARSDATTKKPPQRQAK